MKYDVLGIIDPDVPVRYAIVTVFTERREQVPFKLWNSRTSVVPQHLRMGTARLK